MHPLLYIITLINGLENTLITTKQAYTNFWSDVLHQACFYNNYHKAKLAVLAGADLNKKHKYFIFPSQREEPPLITAIRNYLMYRHEARNAQICGRIIQLLLDHNASANETDNYGRTALHNALYNYTHYTDLIMQLLSKSNVTIKDKFNNTVLHTAIDYKHDIAIIKALINKGADRLAEGFGKKTPLHVALDQAPFSSELIKLLLLVPNIDLATQNGMGETIFHKTAQRHPKALNYLISQVPLKSLIEISSNNSAFTEKITKNKKKSKDNSLRSLVLSHILHHYEQFEKDLYKLPEDLRNIIHQRKGIIYNYGKAIEGLKYLLSIENNWQQAAHYFLHNNESEYKKFHPDFAEENFGKIIKHRIKEELHYTKS